MNESHLDQPDIEGRGGNFFLSVSFPGADLQAICAICAMLSASQRISGLRMWVGMTLRLSARQIELMREPIEAVRDFPTKYPPSGKAKSW
jgi:hypothetical protein